MADFYNPTFKVDDEFSRFSFQVTDEYYIDYKRILQSSKDTSPLIVWKGLIVDGHLQYRACREMNLSFTYKELNFNTRAEVIKWRCNQLLKSSIQLTGEQTRYCIGKLYLAELDYNKYLKVHHLPIPAQQISSEKNLTYKSNKTAIKVSQDVLVSSGTVCRASNHARAIDLIFEKSTPIAHAILNEDVLMSLTTMETLAKYPQNKLQALELFFVSQDRHHITMEDIHKALGQYRQAIKIKSKKEILPETTPQIKQMPVFDPNAALSSLIYTMPSWINIIERAINQTDFSKISFDICDKLSQEIFDMLEVIYKLSDKMEVHKNE